MRMNYTIGTVGMFASEKVSNNLEFFFCKYDENDYRLQMTKDDNGHVMTIKCFDNKEDMEKCFLGLRMNCAI